MNDYSAHSNTGRQQKVLVKSDWNTIIILIYFFINSLFLPAGMLFTMIMAPLFYMYSVRKGIKQQVTLFVMAILPFFLIHWWYGVDLFYYSRSALMVFSVFIFGYAFRCFLKKNKVENYFPTVLKINLALVLIAMVLFFTPWATLLWTIRPLTINIKDFPRLELLTYEPSYYSLLLAPIAIYYTLKIVVLKAKKSQWLAYALLILLPLVLSFSLGVLAALLMAFIVTLFFNFKSLIKKKHIFYFLVFIVVATIGTLIFLVIFYPDNPLYARLNDLWAGKDISAKGRTLNAFSLAHRIAGRKSLLFGVGLGQIKVQGAEIIREFYNYHVSDLASIRIPNAVAETYAMFGIAGLLVRFGLQFYFFFKTRVWNNYFRTMVFSFIFIYQFTGSFFHNTAELVLWIIAFTPCCFLLDRKNKPSTNTITEPIP